MEGRFLLPESDNAARILKQLGTTTGPGNYDYLRQLMLSNLNIILHVKKREDQRRHIIFLVRRHCSPRKICE